MFVLGTIDTEKDERDVKYIEFRCAVSTSEEDK